MSTNFGGFGFPDSLSNSFLSHSKVHLNRRWSGEICKNCQFAVGVQGWGGGGTPDNRFIGFISILFPSESLSYGNNTSKKNKTACSKNACSSTRGKSSLWAAHTSDNFTSMKQAPPKENFSSGRKVLWWLPWGCGYSGPQGSASLRETPPDLRERHWPQPKRRVVRSLRGLSIGGCGWSVNVVTTKESCVGTLPGSRDSGPWR